MKQTMMRVCILSLCLLLAPKGAIQAQAPLRELLKDIDVAPHWIYNDLTQAMTEARASGKPLLVVIRCVPCPPGHTLDVQVMQPDPELERLEKQFVCVRIIQTNGLDLSLFQYDYDMSWSAMFLNSHGTVYGRYGTRNASGPNSDSLLSVVAFRLAAQRALELHQRYPGNKEQLAGKVGKTPDYPVPERIPGLEARGNTATSRQTCIHCHMIKEFTLRTKWLHGRLTPADLWVYPMPDRIGLSMDVSDGLLVTAVADDSPAARSGIEAGDRLESLDGQPLISTADIQWVLHNAASETRLPVMLRRGNQSVETTLALSGEWKKSDISWRASSWYGLRQGVKFDPLPAGDKAQRGLSAHTMALAVTRLLGNGGPKVKQAGVRQGDIIVAVDGKTDVMSESDFLAYLRLEHGPKDMVEFSILRGDSRLELKVPLW